ncbi:cell wall metabolism sensor histidine kinase WalK [Bacillaceae bacterium]
MRPPWRFFQTVQFKVVIIYILLILIAIQLIAAYFIRAVEAYYVNNFTHTLNTQAKLLAVNLERYLDDHREKSESKKETEIKKDIDYLVENLFALNGTEVQVVDQNGIVISATENGEGVVGQKNVKTEVNLALNGTRGETVRVDPQSGQRLKILVVPITKGNKVLGAVYLEASMEEMYQTIAQINRIFASATLLALLLTAGLGVILARTITTPVKEITKQAAAMAEGDFNRRVKIYGEDEIGRLGAAFNHLTLRLKEALSQNEEEKEKLASILSNMSDGVIATDYGGRVILMNQRAEQMLGQEEEYALGKTLYEVLNLPEEEWRTSLKEEGTLLLEAPVTTEQTYLLRVTFSPLQGQGENGNGIIAVLQDVTEQEKLENERKEFVANVSHELRTPLTTLKSYLEALLDGAIKDEQIAPRFLKVAMNETERMIRLVNDLLHLSRIDSKALQLNRTPTDMGQLVHEIVDRFSVQFMQRKLSLHVDAAPGLPPVAVDRDGIHQVLDNLLSNAIKYSNEGGRIRIEVKVEQDEWLSVTVADTGQGIPKRDLPRVFDRFYRVDKARSRHMGGTGLGLSIAREIVKLHGGTIFLESEVGKGTRVTFRLPLMKEGAAS